MSLAPRAQRSLLALLALGLGACSKPSPTSPSVPLGSTPLTKALSVSTLSAVDPSGAPIAGARVLIGSSQGSPFQNNFVTTDSDGRIAAPRGWTTPQPVTIDAPGFVRATYFARMPNSGAMVLRPAPAAAQAVLSGKTTGYGTLQDDGYVHVGIVFRAIARREIGSFQLANFVSQATDEVTVAGNSAQIPSNISIPTQRLTYIFFPVTFDKPAYRAFFDSPGIYKTIAAHARFKLSDAASALQSGKPFLDLVNLLEFQQASAFDLNVQASGLTADLAVDAQNLTGSVSAAAPVFDPSLKLTAIALAQAGADAYFPTDVKTMASGESRTLTAPPGAQAQILFVLKPASADLTGASADALSVALTAAGNAPLSPLGIPSAPALSPGSGGAQTLTLAPPSLSGGIAPRFVHAALSAVYSAAQLNASNSRSGQIKLERKVGKWDLYAEGWPTSLSLPIWPAADASLGTTPLRWEAAFAGAAGTDEGLSQGAPGALGPQAFEKASYVSQSAVDL